MIFSDLSDFLKQPRPRLNFVFISDTFDNGSTFKNFRVRVKLGSAVFLKVQRVESGGRGGGVTALIRINTSKSAERPGVFLGRSHGPWIDKTHLHCSEMADWSDLKRRVPFTSLQYNLLSHISAEKRAKKEEEEKKAPLGIDGQIATMTKVFFTLWLRC